MAASELYCKGARVWLRNEEDVWRPAILADNFVNGLLRVEYEDGATAEVKVGTSSALPPLRNPDILVGLNDLTTLSYLHEPAVLYNLKIRFLDSSTIYTYCGIVLVAINPYEQLPIYGNDVIDAYKGQSMGQMDPHVFAVAEEAYRKMARERKNQSIIVSGESGAGKTVSAKYAMRYFATVGGASAETQIEKKVLASNPIMEAIGNAKTIRNDNSSRFGKYIEIDFNQRHYIIGAHMRTYLLEKSRVVFQAVDERNYHVFYQLCAARQQEDLRDLRLVSADEFYYTSFGGDIDVAGIDDEVDFGRTCEAFSLVNIHEKEQREIFKVVAAILHLGNTVFVKKSRRSEDAAVKKDNDHLGTCATLLGIDVQMLQKWLCNRKIVTKKEVFTKPLSTEQACGARDGLAKHLYAQVFSWIVKQINKCLTSPAKRHSFIGVLDIYGFETFEVNSFEQFCINYANEKLQQQFTKHVFKLEQEEYVKEQIEWSFIDFYDNQPCIDLIESKLGVLDLLDEECRMPKGTDKEWLEKMYQNLQSHTHFAKPRLSNTAFIMKHFAGEVEYESGSFLGKNKDSMVEEHKAILKASKFELVGELFEEERGKKVSDKQHAHVRKTVGSQFSESLVELMKALDATIPHYIRCIKPNDEKAAFSFDPKRAIQQLRACGVLETVRISAAGFPSRWTYGDFFERYRVLIHSSKVKRKLVRETCEFVLNFFIKDPDKFQFGKSKIFFRAGQVAYLEKLRADKLCMSGIMIQKHIRGWLQKTKYRRCKRAAIQIQAVIRGFLARRLAQFLRETKAAVCIQRFYRGHAQRCQYARARRAIVTMQAFTRGMFGRRVYHEVLRQAKALMIQRNYKMWQVRRNYLRMRKAAIYLECCVRRMRARRELKTLKIEARSVDHYKKQNLGLENKVITLQMKLNGQMAELEELRGMKSNVTGVMEELESSKKHLLENQDKLDKVEELEREVSQLRQEKSDLINQINALKEEKQSSEGTYQEENNQLRCQLGEVESKLDSAEEKLRLGSASEEEHLSTAIEKERSQLQSEFDAERMHHQHTLKEQNRLEQRIQNLKDDLDLVNRERRLLETWKLDHSSMLSLHSEEGVEAYNSSSIRSSRAQSTENLLDGGPDEEVRAACAADIQLIMKLTGKIRDLEAGRKGSGSSEVEQLRAEIEELKAETENVGGEGDDRETNEELRRRLESVLKENEALKRDMDGSRTLVVTDGQDVFSSTPVEGKVIRSQLSSHSLGSEITVDDEKDAIQQISALKEANAVLQAELELKQKKTDETIDEIQKRNQQLEEEVAKAQKSRTPGRQQSLDQKLSQEVTRLTVENFDLMEETEKLQKVINELRQSGGKVSHGTEIDGVINQDGVTVTSESVAVAEPQFLGMFEYDRQDETRLFRKVITELDPGLVKDCLPGLPAHILFMCLRYCDHVNDAVRMEHLLMGTITAVRKVVSKRSKDDHLIAFWLSNMCRFLHNMKQYDGGDGTSQQQQTQRLKQFDITEYRMVFNDLAIHIYHTLLKLIQDRLQPMIVSGLLEHESIPGMSHSKPFGLRPVSGKGSHPGSGAYTVASVVKELSRIHSVLTGEYIDPDVVRQLVRQVFYTISAYMLNNLLLRKDMCHWSRGMQIRYNLSQLEEWCRHNHLSESGAIKALSPVIQACQLLQVCKKIQSDVTGIFEMCSALNPLQIQKILTMYTPTNEFEERVPVAVIRAVVAHGADRADPSRLMMDINYQYPVTFPFTPLDINLAAIVVPSKLKLTFLKKI